VPDREKLLSVAQEYLSDYNATSKAPMDLALFSFALEHVVRICRVMTEACTPVVFCLSDTQIQDESFVEDVSSLLNVYEVPNLFPASDMAQILETIRPKAKLVGMDGNRDLLHAFFVQQVRYTCRTITL